MKRIETFRLKSEKKLMSKSSPEVEAQTSGLIFSRNLELKVAAPPAYGAPVKPPAEPEQKMAASDRGTYFQVEARKVVDLLEEEFARLEDSRPNTVIVEGLLSSWEALWGGDDQSPVSEFTGIFGAVCVALKAAGELERGLRQSERETIWEAIQAMFALALAGGRADLSSRSRAALDSCRSLIADLSGSPASAFIPPQGQPDTGLQPQRVAEPDPAEIEIPAVDEFPDEQPDISTAVDEWFSQVSHLVVKGGKERIEPSAPDGEDILAGAEEFLSPMPEEGIGVPEPGVQIQSVENAAREPEEPALETAGLQERQIAWEAAGEKAESPEAGEDFQVVEGAPEEGLEIVEAYFAENCQVTAEVIKKNLPRLAGASAARAARLLAAHVDRMITLACDFGLGEMNQLFLRIDEHLKDLSAAGRGDRVSRSEAVELLRSDVNALEREISQFATPG